MPTSVILSCPFCHTKEEYHDAVANSMVRCLECHCIFRVPANAMHKHKPGTVLAGEAIRTSKIKYILIALVAAALVAGGVWAYYAWLHVPPPPADPFHGIPNLYPEDSAHGVLQRFLEAWKMGDLKLMMKFCRPSDQKNPGDKRFEDWFGNVKLLKADPKGVKRDAEIDVYEYRVDIEGVDKRTKAALKGGMAPRVVLEPVNTPEGKRSVWGIDIDSAAPMWEL